MYMKKLIIKWACSLAEENPELFDLLLDCSGLADRMHRKMNRIDELNEIIDQQEEKIKNLEKQLCLLAASEPTTDSVEAKPKKHYKKRKQEPKQ